MSAAGSSTEGSFVAEHPTIDDLADAAEGLLDPGRAERVALHVAGCPTCQASAAALSRVSAVLAAEPALSMPPQVAERLAGALASESAERTAASRAPRPTAGQPRATLGPFAPQHPRFPPWHRWFPAALAATAVAAVVGLGGSVLSATAGLNEPPTLSVSIRSADLAAQADTLLQTRDLDPHRFSQGWLCARAVTDGRIVGLVRVPVDGAPALLVYTRSEGATRVTVVTGCRSAAPAAGASAELPR
jgi:anti-sigma factor RsiW